VRGLNNQLRTGSGNPKASYALVIRQALQIRSFLGQEHSMGHRQPTSPFERWNAKRFEEFGGRERQKPRVRLKGGMRKLTSVPGPFPEQGESQIKTYIHSDVTPGPSPNVNGKQASLQNSDDLSERRISRRICDSLSLLAQSALKLWQILPRLSPPTMFSYLSPQTRYWNSPVGPLI
jgi:hypothetical protein